MKTKITILTTVVVLMLVQINLLQAQQTTNFVTKFGTTIPNIVNSLIFDNGTSVGIGTQLPTNLLSLDGTAARTIWMERNTNGGAAGQGLYFTRDKFPQFDFEKIGT